eukprot:Sspe_Gene.98458::Locus_71874_Transcript_1_1_Confidence_1.000_Length_1586::g.98458::m.98458/K09584/PDIA6, TXNDC7; protein disulfide-isomerase A6
MGTMSSAVHTVALLLLAVSAHGLYSKKSKVRVLDPAGLREALSGSQPVLLEFFAPWCGHCRNLVPAMEEAAKALEGVVLVAAVDADQYKELGQQYQVRGFPTLLFFGSDRQRPKHFEQGQRTAKSLVAFALAETKAMVDERLHGKKSSGGSHGSGNVGRDVIDLTSSNFEELVLNSGEPWMVEFFAPWCGHCKNLAPEWAAAATELKGTVKFGAVDATVHTDVASQFQVEGYPTIYFIHGNDREQFQGGRSAREISAYALQKLDELGIEPELNEVTNQAGLDACLTSKRLCVLAILPHVIDTGADGRRKYLDTVMEAMKKMRRGSLAFAWIAGGTYPDLEQTFQVQFNYPTVVAINKAKQKYAVHKGAFTTKNIVTTLQKIEKGAYPASSYQKMPSIKDTEPWDGKDYVASDD